MSSYFYLQAEKKQINEYFINKIEKYAEESKKLIYVLGKPLTDQKYTYKYSNALIILSPKNKIVLIDFGNNNDDFQEYVDDIIEDIGSISDKYLYKEVLGRPRTWKENLIKKTENFDNSIEISDFFETLRINEESEKKKIDLLISLFIGSINDITRVKESVPITTLDKVKQKIQLFDGDQTRFVYENPEKKKIRIQGLSGTGKTKLLLHKLKDLYVNDNNSSIFFTCHNKILADNLRKRIPDFFNFMKVEQQILWNKRLWCTNAWGSEALPHSGAYRYICAYYQIPFFRFSNFMPFSKACQQAILEIKEKFKEEKKFAFTYMIIDESQDFVEDFFELCELVTEKNIYIAGDIFQSIFDENISSSIEPDFLLGKCYRTDPKTLMFAHALGMGLFEEKKLRWLEEKEWKDCGYNVTVKESHYYLNREPLRRFEDLEDNFESIEIIENGQKVIESVIKLINTIISENDTVLPDDIGIIFLDEDKSIYQLADILEVKIQSTFNWIVNKAYESKEKKKETLFISNKNNVKGLEFPFVIAITNKIKNSLIYRNSIYTILTRSFIKTYLILSNGEKSGLTLGMKEGLKDIMINKEMVIQEPSNEEKERIRTNFKYKLKRLSYYDLMLKYFKELNIDKQFYDQIIKAVYDLNISDTDDDSLKNLILTMEKALKNK